MILTNDNYTVERVKDMLDGWGVLTTQEDEGLTLEFRYRGEWYNSFAPWDYDVDVNGDGFPEVTKPKNGNDWF